MKKDKVRESSTEQKPSSGAGVDRRNFMKQASTGVLAAAAATALPSIKTAAAQDRGAGASATYDWICVGAGATGMTAAIAGFDLRLKTVLLEKLDLVGGVTAHSGGM